MAVKLGRPILVGGIGLSYMLWLLQSLHHSVVQLGEFGLMGAIAIGCCFWMFQQIARKVEAPPASIDRAVVEKAIDRVTGAVSQLEAELDNCEALARLRKRVAQLSAELDRQELHIAVTGGKSVGKSTLTRVLENSMPTEKLLTSLKLQETPALFTDGASEQEVAKAEAIDADLVLFVTNGDLTD
jgi:hypothetical protein